jgi:PAS domain S-box-containing protein
VRKSVLPYALIASIVALAVAVRLGHHVLWHHAVWVHPGVHAAMEAWTTVFAFVMGVFLIRVGVRERRWRYLSIATAFLTICAMDGAVSLSASEAETVLFHALSSLGGGLWFALAWLPLPGSRRLAAVPVAGALLTLAIGLGLYFGGRIHPELYAWGGMDEAISVAHHASALLYVAGTARFLVDHHRGGAPGDLVFACLTALLATADFMRLASTTWHDEWWIWHGVRIAAFTAAFWFLYVRVHSVFTELDATVERQGRTEEALRDSERRYRLLADFSADCIWTADMGLAFTFVSPAVKKMRGYTPEEACAQSVSESLTPASFARAMEVFAEEMSIEQRGEGPTGKRVLELEMRCKDGSTVWTETIFSYLRDPDGRPEGILGVTRDIGERRAEQDERERLEEELHRAQRLESVGRLAGGVAHDFNNLLAVILNYADFIAAELRPGDAMMEDVDQIRQAGRRAAELTRQLLAFSRKQVMRPEVIDVGAVLGEVETLLGRTIGEDVELTAVCDPQLWPVKADPGRIQQVVMNLVANARDAMPDGGRLSIAAFNEDLVGRSPPRYRGVRPARYVAIIVKDTGSGMTPEVLAQACEPFFTTKDRSKGTGLGLSTAYGIVKQAGGDVLIDSEPGRGTTVKVLLPATEDEVTRRPVRSVPPGPPSRGRTVLVVEDEVSIVRLVRRVLEKAGYVVLEARNGLEAIRIAGQFDGRIDLLLSDVVMPQMSGSEAASTIRARHPGVPILYMSGYTGDTIDRHGVHEEGVAFIQKPFTVNGLLNKVREVLDSGEARGEQAGV